MIEDQEKGSQAEQESQIRAGRIVIDAYGRRMVIDAVLDQGICQCVWQEEKEHCEALIPSSLLRLIDC